MPNTKPTANMIDHLRWIRSMSGDPAIQIRRPTGARNLRTHNALLARGLIQEIAGVTSLTPAGIAAL